MKKNYFFILTLFFLVNLLHAQKSPKRGMAYGYHSVQDLDAIKNDISWWYNWSTVPDAAIATYYQSQGVEFVPMIWNDNYTVANVIAQIPAGTKYLLAFNEPNFTVEANMTPAQAVANWPNIEAVAAAKGLEIVSAVPAYCGGGVCIPGYTDPVVWHNEFFALCPTCKVDYIAFHNYEPTVGGLVALTNNLKVFNRPIWVTEFAYWDPGATEAAKITYLQNALNAFENDPDIYRYSWFAGRSSNNTVSLLGANGTLTNLGIAYMNAAYGPINAIPGTIQAEAQYRRRETGLEACSEGTQNVGWTDPGTWNEYIVNISTTGSYSFTFRVASNVATGSFNIKLDGQLVKSNVTIPNTGGWQTWTNVLVSGVPLTAGEHLLKFEYTGAGTNMNYFTTNFEAFVPATANFSASPLSVCPGNTVTFQDLTTVKSGGETYAWNFGAGATPSTATTPGPHQVTYSSGGQKTVSLAVTNAYGTDSELKTNYVNVSATPTTCLFADDYANSTVNWITPATGQFTHAEANSNWTISNAGYGEWTYFRYTLNNGTLAQPINFACAANKPVLKIRAKSSAFCLLNISLVDQNGRTVDNYNATNLELTTSYQQFTIDYAAHFRNYYSGNPGILDSTQITQIQFMVNPGFASFPITGTNAVYNSYFPGTIDIDWIGIGDGTCNLTLPVGFISFDLTNETNSAVKLSWSTAYEQNNDYFEIQRSTNGINFTTIAIVDGAGNSSSVLNYSYTDNGLTNGTYYYRLKQVDINSESRLTEVKTTNITNVVSTNIEPTIVNKGDAFVITMNSAQRMKINLVDLSGKEYPLENQQVQSPINIPTREYPPGVYLIKIETEQQFFVKKVTIL